MVDFSPHRVFLVKHLLLFLYRWNISGVALGAATIRVYELSQVHFFSAASLIRAAAGARDRKSNLQPPVLTLDFHVSSQLSGI